MAGLFSRAARAVHVAGSAFPILSLGKCCGNVGEEFSDEDAIVIATNVPREFVTPFGLNQPGAQVALKVYVILSTGNEAGCGAMFVQRPASLPMAA